jgi:hypothetical protein
MYRSRNKTDLMIEVWEKLDCESVGGREILAIEDAVRQRFGEAAVESPMKVARLLADEGATLRHAEIMRLYVERNTDPGQEELFRKLMNFDTAEAARGTIRNLENARKKLIAEGDDKGSRQLRAAAVTARQKLLEAAARPRAKAGTRSLNREIAEWLTIWLQTPEMFEGWIKLRQRSAEFREKFGEQR